MVCNDLLTEETLICHSGYAKIIYFGTFHFLSQYISRFYQPVYAHWYM